MIIPIMYIFYIIKLSKKRKFFESFFLVLMLIYLVSIPAIFYGGRSIASKINTYKTIYIFPK